VSESFLLGPRIEGGKIRISPIALRQEQVGKGKKEIEYEDTD
jgi:hypothetical protein